MLFAAQKKSSAQLRNTFFISPDAELFWDTLSAIAATMNYPSLPLLASPRSGLVDRFARVHRSLRISVTDACNIRCQYCMPAEVRFQDSDRHLSFQHIADFVRVTVACGVENYRITGGEPLLRPRLHELVAQLTAIPGVKDLALTTNGMLLADRLPELVDAGLQRVNISLDTLSDSTFKTLSRRDGLSRVLAGIEAAVAEPRLTVKLNTLVLRDVNLPDVLELVDFSLNKGVVLRFVEFMPLDGERGWSASRMVSGQELRGIIEERFGELTLAESSDPSQPSSDYIIANGRGRVGFIDSVSKPFCSACDRLRLTADGKVRNCLFGKQEWEVGELLRQGASLRELQQVLRDAVLAKHAAHGISEDGFVPPTRAMYQIGG